MPDDDFVYGIFDQLRESEESSRRLSMIVKEVKERVGEAPLCFNEKGEVFMHPELARTLAQPGNEGALEFLKYMQRNGITKP